MNRLSFADKLNFFMTETSKRSYPPSLLIASTGGRQLPLKFRSQLTLRSGLNFLSGARFC